MCKLSFVFIVAVAALQIQQNEAFIIVSKSIGAAPAASAAPAFNPNALIQGLTSAVTAKIQTVQSVVNGLVQAKTNFKQNLLQSVLSKVSTASAALPQKTYITKTISFPVFVKGGAAPASTTAAAAAKPDAEATTTSQSAGYAVKYRQKY